MRRPSAPAILRRPYISLTSQKAALSSAPVPLSAAAKAHSHHTHNPAESSTDWNERSDLFAFTRGRFVVDEDRQIKQRHVKFNLNELARIAAQSVGAISCVSVHKCPDGMYNKSFVLTMDDGQRVIAKVPNPNAGVPHYTTASEVATMDFVLNILKTPAPKVYAWNSRADDSVGAEYIIMEQMPGVQLGEAWSTVSFRQYGGLYYRHDWEPASSGEHLYTNQQGERVQDERFTIGPMTGRDWADCGRSTLKCDRGPWLTVSEYHRALGLRELAALSSGAPLPKQTIMVCGPGLYQPCTAKKTAAVQDYIQIHDALLPDDPSIAPAVLWHDDLHEENIFVDPDDPATILGIIDWQSVDLSPLFDHNLDPAFIPCPAPQPETLEQPELEDTSHMSSEERAIATREYFDKALFVASRKITNKMPAAYRAIEYQRTEAFNLLVLARRLFEFGEAHFRALAVELQESWSELPRVKGSAPPTPFPLKFQDPSLVEIQTDCEKAMLGMQTMGDFRARLGPLWPDKDAVSHEQYSEAKAALRELKQEVMDEFAESDADRAEFERLWPFDP